jgi:hypothetical protein
VEPSRRAGHRPIDRRHLAGVDRGSLSSPRRAIRAREESTSMPRHPKITRVVVPRFAWDVPDMGVDYNGFNHVYQAGSTARHIGYVLQIDTDQGISGEYVGGMAGSYAQVGMAADYLLGRNLLERELISDSTSSRVSPAAMQPGRSGTYAAQLLGAFSYTTPYPRPSVQRLTGNNG